MHPDVVTALACPHDAQPLVQQARVLGCPRGHRFDLARQGYASLTARRPAHTGDTPDMLDRRQRVHDAGVLDDVHAAVIAAARGSDERPDSDLGRPRPPRAGTHAGAAGIVCEVGAGPGTYLAAVLDALPDRVGLAIDVAKAAARRAARCHSRAGAIVADVWAGLPLQPASVAVLLDVFAPRNTGEFARVVAPGGILVIATPDPPHLAELRARFGLLSVPEDKPAHLATELAPTFIVRGHRRVRTTVAVPPAVAVDLATMGPSGHHLDPDDVAASLAASSAGAAAGRPPAAIPVTIAATVTRLERRAVDPA